MPIAGLYKIFDRWHEEGTLWIYSDPHFDDTDLITGIKNRPSSEEQVKSINSKCGRKDTIIILGDVGNVEWVKQIRAQRKILIMGNHDTGRTNYERRREMVKFDVDKYTKEQALAEMHQRYPNCRYDIQHGCNVARAPFEYWYVTADNMLFDEVYAGPLMLAEKLLISHEPIDVPWAFNIHGHVHDSKHKNDKRHLNVCADTIGYTPVNMNRFMKSGALARIETIRRETIDKATERKRKRGGKKIGER